MADIITPEITPGVDALLLEDACHDQKGTDPVLLPGALADTEDEAAFIVYLDIVMIGRHVLEEMAW